MICLGDSAALCQMPIHLFQLSKTDSSLNVCHTIVIANYWKPVSPIRVHTLSLELADFLSQVCIVRHDHSALTGRYNFVPKEAERGDIAKGPDGFVIDPRAMCLCSIFNYIQVMSMGNLHYSFHVGWVSINMHNNDRFRARSNGLFDFFRVDVPCLLFAIHKNRSCA